MAYHPQTDGTTEKVNQETEAYLSIYCASHPEDWPQALHTLEFTHNNRRHADRQNTPFELMFGESPVVILLSFESTKYLTIEDKDKMKTLLWNQQEALVAHELARQNGWPAEIDIYSIQEWRPSLVRFQEPEDKEPEDNLSQENEAKTRRTLCYYWSTGTGNL